MSLTRPLCILIKGTHFLRGNPEGTHAELKGNPVIRIIPNIHDYCPQLSSSAAFLASHQLIWPLVSLVASAPSDFQSAKFPCALWVPIHPVGYMFLSPHFSVWPIELSLHKVLLNLNETTAIYLLLTNIPFFNVTRDSDYSYGTLTSERLKKWYFFKFLEVRVLFEICISVDIIFPSCKDWVLSALPGW